MAGIQHIALSALEDQLRSYMVRRPGGEEWPEIRRVLEISRPVSSQKAMGLIGEFGGNINIDFEVKKNLN